VQNNAERQHQAATNQQPVAFAHARVISHRDQLDKLSFSGFLQGRETFHLRSDACQVLVQARIFDLSDPLPHRIGPYPQFLGRGHAVLSLVFGSSAFS
jgi:hypothetical protein